LGEMLGEQSVDEMDDSRDASKILGQVFAALVGKLIAPLVEDSRFRAPKPVDRLSHVAHDKHPATLEFRSSQHFEDLGLDPIGVLKLVNQHELDGGDSPPNRIGSKDLRPVAKQSVSLDQQIIKIQAAPPFLDRLVDPSHLIG